MALSASLTQRQSQSLVMTPQLMQSIQLLQMPYVELLQFIGLEVEKNPLLELKTGSDEDDDGPETGPEPDERLVLTPNGELSAEWYQTENTGAATALSREMDQNFDETYERHLECKKRPIFRSGGVDTFLMTVNRPLGALNYIRVWHDNTGKGNMASWYLKLIIVQDLQTREK